MYERMPDSSETLLRDSVLAAIAAEAATYGLHSMVHAVAPEEMLRSVELGVTRLAHPPYTDIISLEDARRLREAGVAVATTAAGDYAQVPGTEEEVARRYQILLQNIRLLWDAGVIVAFGTDNAAEFTVEVERLRETLTPDEIVMALTGNAAMFLGLEDEVGTIQPGRVADVILLDSDPLVDVLNLTSVKVVIKGGRIVRDDR
jgi:imidazolonepropionase-like amidohydrolase